MTNWGAPLTRLECDGLLKDLALLVPRANLGPDEIDRMLDLYFGLLREAGVTRTMLARACKDFVMAPKKGKPRFFPDPGELAELCADDVRGRKLALRAFQKALEIIDLPGKPYDPDDHTVVSKEQIRALADQLRSPSAPRSRLGHPDWTP